MVINVWHIWLELMKKGGSLLKKSGILTWIYAKFDMSFIEM